MEINPVKSMVCEVSFVSITSGFVRVADCPHRGGLAVRDSPNPEFPGGSALRAGDFGGEVKRTSECGGRHAGHTAPYLGEPAPYGGRALLTQMRTL
jgi:hypothetical protein